MSLKDLVQLHLLPELPLLPQRTPHLLPWLCFYSTWGCLLGMCMSLGSCRLLLLRGLAKITRARQLLVTEGSTVPLANQSQIEKDP